MNATTHDSQSQLVESWAEEAPAVNSVRYLVMRLVRLAGCTVFEAIMLLMVPVIVFTGACCLGWFFAFIFNGFVPPEPSTTNSAIATWTMNNCMLVLPLACAVAAACWGMSLNFGLPYRWKYKIPGMATVICSHCQAEIVDEFYCSECRGQRILSRSVTVVVSVLNVLLTGVWIVHDVTIGMCCMLLKK